MTNKKSTKRALQSSILSLVLCLAMLIGTTFAWFTDSVTSASNRIQSGNLKVDLLMDKSETGKYVSIANGEGDIFSEATGNGILWEPGKTEIVYLAVSNEGTLALKYNIVLDITDTGLAGALEYALIDGAKAADLSAATKWADIEGYNGAQVGDMPTGRQVAAPNGKLEKDGVDYFALAVHMKEEAGNEYQNKDVVIDLQVQATQATVEEDSFGNQYDKDAMYADETYNVTGATFASTLNELRNPAFEGKIVAINLMEDVEYVTGGSYGSSPVVPTGSGVEKIFINGNGKTFKATGAGVDAIAADNGATLVFSDMTIEDESVSYNEGAWEFTYLEFSGNLVFNNVDFKSGIMVEDNDGAPNATARFTNCTFTTEESSVYGAWVSIENAVFESCAFYGTRGLKTHEAYGADVKTLSVNNCEFGPLSEKPGIAIGTLNADTTVKLTNNKFINCQKGDQNLYKYETDTATSTFTFVDENNIVENIKESVKIATKADMFAFAERVNNGDSMNGVLVTLTANIDLNNESWTPIGQTGGYSAKAYFQGIFDGQGYTIYNLNVDVWEAGTDEGKNYASGLFGFIDAADAIIKNVKVDGATVVGHHWTGVIAGYLTGSVTGCTVKNATVQCTHKNNEACGDKAGVIVGYINKGLVTGNTAENCTVTAGRDAGQIVGTAKTAQAYGNTVNNVTVTATGDCTGANIRNEEIGRLN